MAQQIIKPPPFRAPFNIGDSSEKGDTPADVVAKLNANFTDLYAGAANVVTPIGPIGSGVMTPIALNKMRVLLANAMLGTGGPQLVPMMGDSTMSGVGIGSGGGSLANDARLRSWPFALAKQLTKLGIPARIGSFFGDGNMTQFTALPLYDTRIGMGGGWVSNNFQIPGGFAVTFTNVGAGGFNNASSTMSFNPGTDQFDTITIFWGQRGGSATVNVDGGSPLTVANGLSAGLTTVALTSDLGASFPHASSFTVTKGTHTVNVVAQSGTTLDVYAIRCYDSTASYLDLMPVSASGATIGMMGGSGAGFGAGAYFGTYCPNALTLLNLTVNDEQSGTTPAAYLATLNAMLAFNPQPFALVMGPYVGGMGDVVNNGIVKNIISFSAAHNFPVIDYATRWINGATLLTGGDAVHPTLAGNGDIARYMAQVITGIYS